MLRSLAPGALSNSENRLARLGVSQLCFCIAALVAGTAWARPSDPPPEVSEPEVEVDLIGDVDGTNPAPQKALQDTVWLAD